MLINIQGDKMKNKKIISKKDIIIPKGTIFENIDGSDTHYACDNYEYILGLDKDTCATVVVSSENKEYFEDVRAISRSN